MPTPSIRKGLAGIGWAKHAGDFKIGGCTADCDKYEVATSLNWKPGDDIIVPPPATREAAEKRLQEGNECVD